MKTDVTQSRSRTEDVFERLRAEILTGRLKPSAKVKINTICESFGVSLGAVREALSRLTAEGLVISTPQKGAQVAPISRAELLDLTRVRIEVESLALREAIANGGLDWETGIVASYHRLSRTPQNTSDETSEMTNDWSVAHSSFHEALVGGCNSPWLLRLRKMLYDQAERYRRLSSPLTVSNRNVQREHSAMMEAVIGRDADRASALLAQHLNATTEILLKNPRLMGAFEIQNGGIAEASVADPIEAEITVPRRKAARP